MTLIFIPFFGTTNKTRWWFQRFFMFTPILGEMIQFDEHIFQMGWFKPPTRKDGSRFFETVQSLHFNFCLHGSIIFGKDLCNFLQLAMGRIHQVGWLLSSLKQQTQQTASRLGSPLSNELNYKKLAAKKRSERAS